MNLAIIKYNAGNIKSVEFALKRLGVQAVVSDDIEVLQSADKIIFPGVGNAASAMESLRKKDLDKLIPVLKQPVLGICLGMQLLCRHTEEGDTPGLDIIPLQVRKFSSKMKVPHTGWNQICDLKGELFKEISEEEYMYFVHSYYAETGRETVAACEYGFPFSAAIQKNNFYGVQFHTELSADAGSSILSNFLNIKA